MIFPFGYVSLWKLFLSGHKTWENMEWSCEEDIIRDLQHGDRKAYSFLFKKYYPMLCAYCSRFVSLEDAEEIVQDTLF